MSYEQQIKDTVLRLTLNSIVDVLREFRLDSISSDTDEGYQAGIDQAIKAVQLFHKVIDKEEQALDE